jgi:hypothetical protein
MGKLALLKDKAEDGVDKMRRKLGRNKDLQCRLHLKVPVEHGFTELLTNPAAVLAQGAVVSSGRQWHPEHAMYLQSADQGTLAHACHAYFLAKPLYSVDLGPRTCPLLALHVTHMHAVGKE